VAAEALYRQILATAPDHPDALHLLGMALAAEGRTEDAVAAIERALAREPQLTAARVNLGTLYQELGRPEQALACYRQALEREPDAATTWSNLGNTLQSLGRPAEAEQCHRRAVRLAPRLAVVHANLGTAYWQQGRVVEAEASLRRARVLAPADAGIIAMLGTVLRDRGRGEEAEDCYREALARDPADARTWSDLGRALADRRRFIEAEACLEEALHLAPALPSAAFNRALLHLARGDLSAWDDYDQRLVQAGIRSAYARTPNVYAPHGGLSGLGGQGGPGGQGGGGAHGREAYRHDPVTGGHLTHWYGEPLGGQRLLIRREQGLGDELMFATLYPALVRSVDAPLVIECDSRLVRLLGRALPGVDMKAGPLAFSAASGIADYELYAGSLARVSRRTLGAWAPVKPFATGGGSSTGGGPCGARDLLTADPARTGRWRQRLAALGPGITVGLCWRSGQMTADRAASYTRLDEWGPVLAVPGCRFVCLQYDECGAERADAEHRFGVPLHHWPDLDQRNDLDETAALISALDLVLSAPTAVGELAASLGTPTWRFDRVGSWTLLGTRCRPWFPAMRLFVVGANEPLAIAIERMARALGSLAGVTG